MGPGIRLVLIVALALGTSGCIGVPCAAVQAYASAVDVVLDEYEEMIDAGLRPPDEAEEIESSSNPSAARALRDDLRAGLIDDLRRTRAAIDAACEEVR